MKIILRIYILRSSTHKKVRENFLNLELRKKSYKQKFLPRLKLRTTFCLCESKITVGLPPRAISYPRPVGIGVADQVTLPQGLKDILKPKWVFDDFTSFYVFLFNMLTSHRGCQVFFKKQCKKQAHLFLEFNCSQVATMTFDEFDMFNFMLIR